MSNITMHQLSLDFEPGMSKTRESKSCEKKKTGNVRLVTKRDCWEFINIAK